VLCVTSVVAGSLVLLVPAAGASVSLGVNAEDFYANSGVALSRFSSLAEARPQIAMWFQDWTETWSTAILNPALTGPTTASGAIPMVTWLPDLDTGDPSSQPAYSLADIASGRYDDYVHRAAVETAAYQRPVFIRLAPEMNGDWLPWGAGVNGNTPAEFIAMWRHVVSIFRAAGATNAKWVWSPNVNCNGKCPFEAYYPGDAWVDWVALDGYNYAAVDHVAWMSFGALFKPSYDALTALTAKPLMIAETASTERGGNESSWISAIPQTVSTQMPRVRAMIWFDRRKETDWRINSSTASLSAFRAVVRSGFFAQPASRLLQLTH
jgi:hypothetical protein